MKTFYGWNLAGLCYMMSPIVFVFGLGHQSPTRSAGPESKHHSLVKRRKKFGINFEVKGNTPANWCVAIKNKGKKCCGAVCICFQFPCILYRYFRTELSAVASEVFIIRATHDALLFKAFKRRVRRALWLFPKDSCLIFGWSHAWNQIHKCEYQSLAQIFLHTQYLPHITCIYTPSLHASSCSGFWSVLKALNGSARRCFILFLEPGVELNGSLGIVAGCVPIMYAISLWWYPKPY